MNIKSQLKPKLDQIAFLFIFISACLLRFSDFGNWSLTNDELSSWNRTLYPSLSDLIHYGVVPDGHPALNQLFLYFWLKIVADVDWLIRLPYVILSCFGLYYFYAFALRLLNKKAAILFLITLSFSYLFVVYHQIARPYSLGFFVLSVFSFYWIKYIQEERSKDAVLLVIYGTLSLYTHYFLALSSASLLLVGLIMKLNKIDRSLLNYLLVSLAIPILFLPHLSISLNQFSQGGLNWLPPPESDFLIRFLEYSLNGSWILIGLILIAPVIALLTKSFGLKGFINIGLLLLFLLPFVVIFQYSLKVKPVIQFSSLIFAFPFLLLFFFSFIKESMNNKVFYSYSSVLFIAAVFTLFYPRNLIASKDFANFKGVSEKLMEWNKEHSNELTTITNANDPNYLEFYLRNADKPIKCDVKNIANEADLAKCYKLIVSSETKYLALGFANVPLPAEVYELARLHYPRIIHQDRSFNSEAILLSNEKPKQERKASFNITVDKSDKKWEVGEDLISDSIFYTSAVGYHIRSMDEYALTYRCKVSDLSQEWPDWLTLSAKLRSSDRSKIKMVVAIDRNGEQIDWRSMNAKLFYREDNWYDMIFVYPFVKDSQPDDNVTIYFWNPDGSECYIDDFTLTNYEDANFDYYQLK